MSILEISDKKFEDLKIEAQLQYGNIGEVYCPYLKQKVRFNAKGLEHIKFKRFNLTRTRPDQYMRLKLLKLAPEILKASHTLQGYLKQQELERQKINSRWEKQLKQVEYYEFVAVVKEVRVKVIVKWIDGGEPFFWSLIPFWRQSDLRSRLLYDGNPSID